MAPKGSDPKTPAKAPPAPVVPPVKKKLPAKPKETDKVNGIVRERL